MTKEVSLEEFTKIWEDCKSRMLFSSPGIDPIMKRMTVKGLSGPGTSFANEHDRMMHGSLNPTMPRFIDMVGINGTERIVIKGSK